MKVLVMSVSTGQGHHQAAKSAVEALAARGAVCETLDVYEYVSPAYSEFLSRGYLLSTKVSPREYGLLYRQAEKQGNFDGPFSFGKLANMMFSGKLTEYLQRFAPDAIVCTHVLSAHLVTALRKKGELREIPVFGIVTDFTLHPFWEDTMIDYYVTPSALMNLQLCKRGLPEEKILPFGIPIGRQFATKRPKEEARALLGLEQKDTVLIMSGSMGYGHLTDTVRQLDSLPLDLQLICVCGKNTRAKRKIDRLQTQKTVLNFGFTDQVSDLMDAADCIVTKPGGLTSSEALAKELFMVLINPIPGQEDRNGEFLVNNGAALRVSKTVPVDEAVYQIMTNTERREKGVRTVRALGKPDAAEHLADFIIGLLS